MTLKLTPESITHLNRLGHSSNFAWTKTHAGFFPTDKIECGPDPAFPALPGLGDYLDSLSSASSSTGLTSFITPNTLIARNDPVTDEFNGSTLDPSWTRLHTVDPGTISRGLGYSTPNNSGRESFSDVRPGWLMLQLAGSGGYHKSLITRAAPAAATLYCRFSMDANSSFGDSFSFWMTQTLVDGVTPDTDNSINIILSRVTNDTTWSIRATHKVGGTAADIYASTSLASFAQPVQGLGISYFTFEGQTTYLPFAITDAGSWKSLGSYASSTLVLDRLLLLMSTSTTPNPIFGLDYVRREAGTFLTK